MPLVIQAKARPAFPLSSPPFTRLEETERTDEAETGREDRDERKRQIWDERENDTAEFE